MDLTNAAMTVGAFGGQTSLMYFDRKRQEKVQMENTRKLMDLQKSNQMELNRQGQQIQQETWEKTNYPRQIEMLKEAGMNPSLLYSKGGSGGVTGSQGGGSASSGSAPNLGMLPLPSLIEAAKLKSEIDVNKSIANLNNTNANKTAGVDTDKTQAEIKEITQNIANEEVKNEILKIDEKLKQLELSKSELTFDAYLKKVHEELRDLKGKADKSIVEGENAKELQRIAVQKYKNEAYATVLQNQLSKQNINKTKQETVNMIEELQIKWAQLGLNERDISVKEYKNRIDKFVAEMNASTPAVGNVLGNMIWRFQDDVSDMFGVDKMDRMGEKIKD
jgi:hypothetical protein